VTLLGRMQRLTSSWLFKVLFALIAVGVVWLAAAFFEYRYERNLAKAAIRTVGDIQVGYSTQALTELMLKPYAKFRVGGSDNAIQLAFVNRRWLQPLRSPTQWIYITVEFTDGVVSSRSFQFLDQPRRRASISQRVLLSADMLHLGGYMSHRKIGSAGDPASPFFVTDVREDLQVPEALRSRDWQFDLQCFRFVTSCKDLRGVLAGANPQ
jgi:hypothetical protein